MTLRLESAARSGDQVVKAKDLRVVAGNRVLLDDVSVSAMRGDVIALVGPNGAGKSTLLATLLGARPPSAGSAELGPSVTAAWYRQDLAGVPLDTTIFDVIHDLRPGWNRGQVQGHLGAFGFSGDEVRRSTSSLSGGERARVALAMITLSRANLLVLDEPTNHLDVESIEALEDAVEDYDGTVIVVSHDRAFLRELATRVWAIEGGGLRDYTGPFVDWEVAEEERRRRALAAGTEAREAARAAGRARAARSAAPKPSRDDRRAAAERAEEAEREVARLEARVGELTAALADPALYDGTPEASRRAADLGRGLADTRRAAAAALERWTIAVDALEK